MIKQLTFPLLFVFGLAGAGKMSTQEVMDLALKQPDSPQFQEALEATLRQTDVKAGTAALSVINNLTYEKSFPSSYMCLRCRE